MAVPEWQLEGLKASKILMIDDEPSVLDVLEVFLSGEGYSSVLSTPDSRQAIDLVRNELPDVVLLDLNMPNVSGFDILAAMRADETFRYTPVLVLTSATDAETKLKALELGATEFLSKPIDPSELGLRLRNTLAAKAYQDRLAHYDRPTDLPNRRSFIERTDRILHWALRGSRPCGMLHIVLDQMERINDTLGHRVGDGLLRSIARRLEVCHRGRPAHRISDADENGILARVGPGEFAMLLPSVEAPEELGRFGRTIIRDLTSPFVIDGNELFVDCSVGISVFPDDGLDAEVLLRHARMAHAKRDGGSSFYFYSRSQNEESLKRLSLETQLRRAVEREELSLDYQPQFDVRGGALVGAEALIRWQHPQLGVVLPDRFIPIAEEAGLMSAIGDWAMRTAFRQTRAWRDCGHPLIRIAINVASQQFEHGDIVNSLSGALEESGLEPRGIVVELTEGAIMANPQRAARTLDELKEMQIGISVDDFGTGYSALSHLKRFPVDELKIDRSFIGGIPGNGDDAAIVTAIIAMARSLGLRVVAEGVESAAQLEFLAAQDCDDYQGFLGGRPMLPTEWEALFAVHAGRDGTRSSG